MKRIFIIATTTFFTITAISFASPGKDEIVSAEKGAWQSIKDKKFDQFQKMVATDFRGVYASGINTADKENAEVRTLDLKSFTLGEVNVIFVGKDTAMTTYSVEIQGTEAGKDISGK